MSSLRRRGVAAGRGWVISISADGRAAHEALRTEGFDGRIILLAEEHEAPYELGISDLRMPGVSGVVLHDRLAVQRPAVEPATASEHRVVRPQSGNSVV